ncbi:YesL family protein [Alkalicoccobacillus murimartini]|nr:DUF624 domain-containing protein [Alkalicoccobacillus murimartini]
MMSNSLTGGIYAIGEFFLFLVKLNVLWFIGTLAGLVIFGFGPSTLAMFDVLRRWMRKETDVPVWRNFWQQYKIYLFRGNALTLTFLLATVILYVNITLFVIEPVWLMILVKYALFIISALLILTVLYVFPATVHFDLQLVESIKQSFFIGLYMPLRTIYLVAAILTVYHILFLFPILIFLFGISLFGFIQMWIVLRSFARLEDKQARMVAAGA